MTATVFAAASELGRFRLVNNNEDGAWVESETYSYPFGAQLREYIHTHEGTKPDWETEMISEEYEIKFSSFDEAADFLGITIPSNTLLPYKEVSCWVYVTAEGEHAQATLFAVDLTSQRTASIFFSQQRMETPVLSSSNLIIDESTAVTYVSPVNGIEAYIVLSEEGIGTAQFYLDDVIIFQLCRSDYADDIVQALKDIIDAFE